MTSEPCTDTRCPLHDSDTPHVHRQPEPGELRTTPNVRIELPLELFEQLTNELQELRASRLLCVGCYLEVHAGQRDHANPAVLNVGGNSTCAEHVQIGPAPALPGRTASGLHVPGVNGS